MLLEPIAKNGIDIDILKATLSALPVGEVISYADLSAAIGRDVQYKNRYLLISACDRLLKDKQMVFGAVFNVGIKRLTPDEAVTQVNHVLKRVRTIARRGAAKIAATDYNSLSTDDLRQMHNSALSLLAAVIYSADARQLNRLNPPCTNAQPTVLPTAATLKLLAA